MTFGCLRPPSDGTSPQPDPSRGISAEPNATGAADDWPMQTVPSSGASY